MLMSSFKQWGTRFFLMLISFFVAYSLDIIGQRNLNDSDEIIRDKFIRFAAKNTEDRRIAIIDIDESSLSELGAWPWSRNLLADIIEKLYSDHDVSAIGLDMVFPYPRDENGDKRLAALAHHLPMSLSLILDYSERESPLNVGTLSPGVPLLASNNSVRATGHIGNHTGLSTSPCVGNIGYTPDADGRLRHIPIVSSYNNQLYLTLSASLLYCTKIISSGDAVLSAGQWRIPYTFSQDSYLVYSAAEVLFGKIPTNTLSGRIVLIGSSALSLGDQVSTPLASLTSGVMVHAAALSGLIDIQSGNLNPFSTQNQYALLWLSVVLLASSIILSMTSPWIGLAWTCAVSASWLYICFLAFKSQILIPILPPLIGFIAFIFLATPFELWVSRRRGLKLFKTLSQYVSRPVLDEIIRRNLQPSLALTQCRITVLVADMHEYTKLTSSLSLEMSATITRRFLALLTHPVLSHGGTLDRYSGDGLVAFWGAPLPCADSDNRAVHAAKEILESINSLNNEYEHLGIDRIQVRIGIESGIAMVGDLGTPFRSTYTAVGDCINHASRLEGAAKQLGVPLLIGPGAAACVTRNQLSSMGTITLRNTNSQIEVFTLTEFLVN
jgi:adenylate cyclase